MSFFKKKESAPQSPQVKETPATVEDAAVKADGAYSDTFAVEFSFSIAPKAVDVGIKRAKLFKDKMAVQGRVETGHFGKEDVVTLIIGGTAQQTTVLGAYKDNGSGLDQEMAANLQKKGLSAGQSGWLILDVQQDIPSGSSVVK